VREEVHLDRGRPVPQLKGTSLGSPALITGYPVQLRFLRALLTLGLASCSHDGFAPAFVGSLKVQVSLSPTSRVTADTNGVDLVLVCGVRRPQLKGTSLDGGLDRKSDSTRRAAFCAYSRCATARPTSARVASGAAGPLGHARLELSQPATDAMAGEPRPHRNS